MGSTEYDNNRFNFDANESPTKPMFFNRANTRDNEDLKLKLMYDLHKNNSMINFETSKGKQFSLTSTYIP